MKKLIINLILPFALMGYCYGQAELKPTIGFNLANISKDPETGDVSAQAGWQVGATVLYGEKFYVEGGALFVKKSTEFTSVDYEPIDASDIKFAYSGVRIPVMVGIHLLGNEETLASLRVFGGGSVFFVTGVDIEGLDTDDFTSPTGGLLAGAGLDIAFLFLDVQYEWSLSNVSAIDNFDLGKFRSFFVNAGVRIRL